ncbi:MAG: AAA family ATPase [Dehalococcoidales bacterium]
MTFAIAVAGKGGSGKTSIASLIIRYLKNNRSGAILAVDADANANLGDGLGLKAAKTIGAIIAAFNEEKINIPPGMTKEAYLEIRLNEAIVESPRLDMITMGRGEGPACYCYPNAMLRHFIDRLADNYSYIVLDNEAGLEHLSRRTTQNIDRLFLITDHSIKGVRTIARIVELIEELKLKVKKQSVVINFVPGAVDSHITEELKRLMLEPAALVPVDEQIRKYDLEQKPLLELPDSSAAVRAVGELMDRVLNDSQ